VVSLALLVIARASAAPRTRWLALACCVFCGLLVTARVFSLVPATATDGLLPLVPNRHIVAQQRSDFDEVVRLIAYLDGVVRHDPGYIYVLGSGSTLSDHTIAYANLSLGSAYLCPQLVLGASHIDRRDGFPRMLLEARYVVLTSPLRLARPDEQRVVSEPAALFRSGSGFAAAFAPMPPVFALEDGVEARIWARTRPSTAAEIAELSQRLRCFYPDRPDIYQP
jgi:hypothetical protein